MLPLIVTRQEPDILKAIIDWVVEDVRKEQGTSPQFIVGTMI